MKISTKISTLLNDAGRLKTYAVWLFLKQRFVNSTYYNFNWHHMAAQTGLSRPQLKRYVAEFVRMGWCWIDRGNLRFTRHTALRLPGLNTQKLRMAEIPVLNRTVKGIHHALYVFLIANGQRQQEHRITKQRKTVSNGACSELASFVILTVRRLARRLKLSIRNCNRILLALEAEGWFTRTRQWVMDVTVPPVGYEALTDTKRIPFKHFYHSGLQRVIGVLPSQWVWMVDVGVQAQVCNPPGCPPLR